MDDPGDAVVGPNGIVGVRLGPKHLPPEDGEGFILDGNPVMTCGDVYVRPVTDVRKDGEVMIVVPSGKLAMHSPGRLPGRAMVLQDARWGSDAKAGELAILSCGIKMRAAREETRIRALLASEDDE